MMMMMYMMYSLHTIVHLSEKMPAFPTQVFNSLVLIWLTSAMAAKTVDSDYTGTQQCMVARSENKDYTGLQQREGPGRDNYIALTMHYHYVNVSVLIKFSKKTVFFP